MRVPFTVSMLVGVALVAAPGASKLDHAHALLRAAFSLSSADMSRIDGGQVVSRTLDVHNRREVATLGIVRIETRPAAYVERLVDIATFKRTDKVLQVGTFGSPPQSGDVAALTVDESDLKRLRDCRVNDCDVRLSAEGIERFRREIDWREPAVSEKANVLLRQLLVEYVTRYRENGAAAAMEYADTSLPLNVGREFASLVDADTAIWKYAPRLRRHLLDYPGAIDDRVSDFIYWSNELVHGRPVITITHVVIAHASEDSPVQYAIGSKQIYATHYFDASLGLTLLVRDPAASSPATYVVYLNRSRIDLFDGVFGGVARRIAAGRARSLVAEQLGRLQRVFAGSRAVDSIGSNR
jgi:hypothetical protein